MASDILERIRNAETMPLDPDGKVAMWGVLQDAREGITRLRKAIRRLAEQDATLSVCEGNVTVTMDATLTDAEREAVEVALVWVNPKRQSTLRGLLERP